MNKTIKYLFIVSCFLSIGFVAQSQTKESVPTIDLEPRKGWIFSGFLSMRADDRFYLLQDGDGIAWKSVELNIDEYPIMLVRAGNTLPRERWKIFAKKSNYSPTDVSDAVCLIDNFALEGGFIINIKKITDWSGTVNFTMMIMIAGKKGDCIEFDALEVVRMKDELPSSPKLSAPTNGISLSPLSLHFCWLASINAIGYELQISRQNDFSKTKSFHVEPQYLTDKISYLPLDNELLSNGKYFWRVKGININNIYGTWSDTGTFIIRTQTLKPQPPELTISSSHPLIILFSDENNLVTNWNAVPDDLKPHTVFRVEALPSENLFSVARKADENKIPVIIQTSGPHDDYGRMAARITLADVEQILQNYKYVKGVYICEQAFRVFPPRNRIMMDYARRLIQLSAEYGRTVFWADGHWGRNLWIDVGLNKDLITTIQNHSEYFVPLWKTNSSATPYSIHSSLLGLWLSGAVDNWGIQPERWYWYEAGFGKLGKQLWFKEGVMDDFPPTFYGQIILLGLSSGASVYSMEPSSDIWNTEGHLSDISREITFPILSTIIKNNLVSERSEIMKKIRLTHVAEESDSPWDLNYGTLHSIYKTMYGFEHPFQIIPSSSQNYYLPILSKWTPASILESFAKTQDIKLFNKDVGVEKYFKENQATQFKGNAWVVSLDKAVLVMNSKENQDINQSFDVLLNGNVHRISGELSVNSYLIGYEPGDEFKAQLNGRVGKNIVLKLYSNKKPHKVFTIPQEVLQSDTWLDSEGCQMLNIQLTQKVVNLKLLFSE